MGNGIYILIAAILAALFVFTFSCYRKNKKRIKGLVEENVHLKEDNKKLEHVEKMKSEFITIAAHQLRTPLTKMKWVLQALLKVEDLGPLNEKQKDMVMTGYDANEKMVKLVNDFLGIGKAEETTLGYNFEKSSVLEVAEGVVKNFFIFAKQKKVEVSLKKPDGELPSIMMDPWKINLALSNLVENAINYTPAGGKVGVNVENFGNCIRISVKDTGIGIPEDEIARLFSRFFRARNAMKVEPNGTGLGLYIAKNIVRIHGGEIWAESEEGKGSTFYFTLPFNTEVEVKKNIESFVESV